MSFPLLLAVALGALQNFSHFRFTEQYRFADLAGAPVLFAEFFQFNRQRQRFVKVVGGDVIYVHRAPVFYIYGEAQRPGAYRIERDMTVQQALAQGGGTTQRGMEYWIRLHRRNASGQVERISPDFNEPVKANDVIYIRESLF